MLKYIIIICFFIYSCSTDKKSLGYDPNLDVVSEFEAMKEKAKQEGKKRLLLIFGANWCGDCMAMDRILGEKEIQNVLAESYLLMKVDIGHFDKNLDFVRRFGNPIEKGIPSFVIIDEAGSILVSTNNGKFSKARKMKSESVLEFLLQYH